MICIGPQRVLVSPKNICTSEELSMPHRWADSRQWNSTKQSYCEVRRDDGPLKITNYIADQSCD